MTTWRTNKLKRLAKALLAIKNEQEMLSFLRDIATLEELEALSSRWDVVLELEKGTSYREIAKKTGVSTATITRIAHWLKHGEGGYRAALMHIKKA
ncbi:DNA-binding transcriptional regulator [Candidatus Uhrbacteria bacterium]|nr:DNA-binding transcriptional regulator [Candidatus Uhrbacteria bacterium]